MNIGICGAIGLIFLILKLASVIAWSWWLVLLPFFIPLLFWGIILSTIVVLLVVSCISEEI